jgi:ATP-dependent Lhr-like helicase
LQLVACDTPEPSPLAAEILNAKPYAFLDDAPLEERRSHAVATRRANDPSSIDDMGRLDAAAIDRVREEVRPDPRDADELHDTLLTAGFLTEDEAAELPRELFEQLTASRRATLCGAGNPAGEPSRMWIAAERLPELLAIHHVSTNITPPASRLSRTWTREEAIVELFRGRLTILGPTTSRDLAASLGITESDADLALLALESEGVVLRGRFENPQQLEWCDRRLLARIHRYTLGRLRAEIEPVSAADFQRFLFAWQHVTGRLMAADGLRKVIEQLDGYEVAGPAWERNVLPARIERYDSSLLDVLCLSGEVGWAKRGGVVLFRREHAGVWLAEVKAELSDAAQMLFDRLRAEGAQFLRRDDALEELIDAGLVTADGFLGRSGRWSILPPPHADVQMQAWTLLRRYGVVFRRLAAREPNAAPWRDLAREFRRLEARGEIRGGRFVHGMSGEQFALPEAVERLREIRRQATDGSVVVISAADPLNLTGILVSGERIRAIPSNRIAYRDGVAVSVMEGDYLRPLSEIDDASALHVASTLAGRKIAVTSGFVGRFS